MRVVSEGPTKITRSTTEAAWKRRAPATRLVVRDAECRGLALVINPTGMTWRLEWKPRGVDPATGKRWPSQAETIGTPESHSPDAARDAAGRLKGATKAGADLGAQRRERAAVDNQRRAATVTRLIDAYAVALPRRPKLRGTGPLSHASAGAELAHVRLAVTTMGIANRPLTDVKPADLRRLLIAEAERPATARKHFGAFSRFCDWAVAEGDVSVNPCILLPKAHRPRAVASRPNCPSLPDLAKLWQAADSLPNVQRDLVRFLISVPCRLREATRLDWRHLQLAQATWAIPAQIAKTRETHLIHLPDLARSILADRHSAAGGPTRGLVFPGQRAGRPIETLTSIKQRLTTKSGVFDWTFHDFRRAFASACAERGVHEAVADAVLSHRQSATRGGVLGVYQRARRWPEQVSAMEVWGSAMQDALDGRQLDENDVAMGRAARLSV